MNVETVLTSIVTGLLVGYFGVLLALKQFKAQRAFERQLDWCERTHRALSRMLQLQFQMDVAKNFPGNISIKAEEELLKGWMDLEQCRNEAVLYANQKSYDELNRVSERYERIRQRATNESKDAPMDSRVKTAGATIVEAVAREAKEVEMRNEVLRETLIEISKPMRKILGLKAIKLLDSQE